jgi:hypothetical protein
MEIPLKEQSPLCPSARCREDALLLGVIGTNGQLNMIKPPMPITKDFIDVSSTGRRPELRFRFADKCQTSGCSRWINGQCAVATHVAKSSDILSEKVISHQDCMIRKTCRWYLQEGSLACHACSYIVTDNDDIMS